MRRKHLIITAACAVVFWLSLMFSGLAQAQERILSFDSDIVVHTDATMTVTETIRVRSTAHQIRHGIYRDFPTSYRDRFGNNYIVGFDVLSVARDGQSEGYHFENLSNGKRVYFGRSDTLLSPGEYTYTFTYKTSRQIGFFKDSDELYWNVTGNGWSFSIDNASATVKLPTGAVSQIIETTAYTGFQGSRGTDFRITQDDSGNPIFTSTRILMPNEGLTIVVSWPKGFVKEPTNPQRIGYFLNDNRSALFGFLGIFVILSYYLIIWSRYGKDPAKGTIIPLYSPPDNISPAAMRYIMKMGYDPKIFACAIINMAAKGCLTIQEKIGVYSIHRKGNNESFLAPEESAIIKHLQLTTKCPFDFDNEHHAIIRSTIDYVKMSLKNSFEKNYFLTNRQYFIPGAVLSAFIVIITALLSSPEKLPLAIFISVWLTGWSLGVVFLLGRVVATWKMAMADSRVRVIPIGGAIFLTVFSVPFVIGEFAGLGFFIFATSSSVAGILLATVLLNCLFYHLLKAPTFQGRKAMDKMEGFKMYLSVAEKDRLNYFNSPQKTPELFEKHLPYALALDVEQKWAEYFSDVLAQSAQGGEGYHPAWYSGSGFSHLGAAGFVSDLGSSLSNAVSSASVAPGSSSGGGGGGSSGGGGGGGGGGGW
ncbi:MAG TPA: DUF2207 domain-containing protein [Candidatus Omnitrophota bacterium]|nr:DUF2207 domain-containing protein [Candidatus Omnitrophota bacterium]HPD84788.1 DUF2207 domain-containing protein [Candidatus Omnitrophota bacterium]HRZ03646.1 DUF2207 domain-containing protein [Candidatus Omnitrophota bacterium]